MRPTTSELPASSRRSPEQNPDPVTRREAIEQELAEEGLSDEGADLGQHNE